MSVQGACGWLFLEEQSTHTANFTLFFYEDLKVLVDDGNGQQDSCSWANSTQEISHDREATYTQSSESCSCGDVPTTQQQIKESHHIFDKPYLAIN